MNEHKYFFTGMPMVYYYDFVSIGPKGKVHKRVCLRWIGGTTVSIYNLSFGDLDSNTGAINDEVTTNNRDRRKVLATVAAAILAFLSAWPGAYVVAQGSTDARNRLYQAGILSVLDEINEQLILFGRCHGRWEPFRKGINYDAFMVTRRYHPPASVIRMPRNDIPPRMSMLQ